MIILPSPVYPVASAPAGLKKWPVPIGLACLVWECEADTTGIEPKQTRDYTSPILFPSRTLELAGLAAHNSKESAGGLAGERGSTQPPGPPAQIHFERSVDWRGGMTGKARWTTWIAWVSGWPNWRQVSRTVQAAWWVWRTMRGAGISPGVRRAIEAAESAYQPPQPGWRGAAPREVQRWAGRLVRFPRRWGRCVQESLIVYRTLSGYGIPATFCLGLSTEYSSEVGHAWVETLSTSQEDALPLPREPFLIVYRSPRPAASSISSRQPFPTGGFP